MHILLLVKGQGGFTTDEGVVDVARHIGGFLFSLDREVTA
jgi:hypothetical protein